MKQIRHEEAPGEPIKPLEPARREKLEQTVPRLTAAQRRRQRQRYLRWRFQNLFSRRLFPAATVSRTPLRENFAVAIIGVGPRYRAWARILVQGLRAVGRYTGPVYIVTDDPTPFTDMEDTHCIRIASTRHQMVIKTCKTFLHEWVPQRYVLYLDADVLAGLDIRRWCEQALDCVQQGHAALFYPDPSARAMPYHGGLMLIDSEKARPFFMAWRRCLASGRFRQDQEALLACAESFALGRPPAYGLSFPDPQSVLEGHTDCFIHLTSYRYSQLGHDVCRAYLCDTLGLTPEQAEQRLDFG